MVTESKQYAGAEPRLDPCPLCRGTQGALLFRLPFEQVWGPHSIDRHGEFLSLYRCRSCALETYSIAPRFARGKRMQSKCGLPPRAKG